MPPMYEFYYVAHWDMLQKRPRNFHHPPPDHPPFFGEGEDLPLDGIESSPREL